MSLKNSADNFVRTQACSLLGKNIRRYTWQSYTGEIGHNMLGGVSRMATFEGKVVAVDEQFTLFKIGSNQFRVVLTELLTQMVGIGDTVKMSFYDLRRFDGTAADGSDDPIMGNIRTIMLTGAATQFPVKWGEKYHGRYLGINERFESEWVEIQNPYLRDLITQMEKMPVDGGRRYAVNVLVDANPTNLRFNDSSEDDVIENPPAIHVDVATQKFTGHVEINYDRGIDYYRVALTPVSGEKQLIEDISFDELGDVLIHAIDDRQWTKAKVEILKAAPKARAKVAVMS